MLQGLAIDGTADRHHAAGGVGNDLVALVVAVWAGLAERGDRCHHQAGIFLFQTGVVQAAGGEVAGRETLDDDVDIGGETAQDRGTLVAVQVQGDAALVQIQQQVEQAFFRIGIIVEERRRAAADLAGERFDLYDVATEVANKTSRQRPGNALADIENPYIVKRQRAEHC